MPWARSSCRQFSYLRIDLSNHAFDLMKQISLILLRSRLMTHLQSVCLFPGQQTTYTIIKFLIAVDSLCNLSLVISTVVGPDEAIFFDNPLSSWNMHMLNHDVWHKCWCFQYHDLLDLDDLTVKFVNFFPTKSAIIWRRRFTKH